MKKLIKLIKRTITKRISQQMAEKDLEQLTEKLLKKLLKKIRKKICIMEYSMKPDDIKQQQASLSESISEDELEVVYDKDRDIKVPLKVGLRKEVQLSDLPVMWLFALGNLTIPEYNDYLKQNEGKLSINEITASDLLAGVLKKDEKCVQTYWRLNEKMLNNRGAMTNNIKIDIKPDNIMTKLLSSIEGEIFGEKPLEKGDES